MSDRIESMQAGALAEAYARPLFDLATKAGVVDLVREQLDEVVELLQEHPSLQQVFVHKAIDPDRRAATIKRLFEGRADDLVVRFLLVLNNHSRLDQLPHIRTAYDQALKVSRNQVDVAVYTAKPLEDEQREQVAQRLTQAIGREAIIHAQTDERLIGGMRIRFDNTLVDASVASQLRRLARQMAATGHDAIRASAARLLTETENGQPINS